MGDSDAVPLSKSESEAKQRLLRKEQLKGWLNSDTASFSSSIEEKSWKVCIPNQLLFLSACHNGDIEFARVLLNDSQLDINTKNSDGLAALHQATLNTDEEMINFLLENGADIDVCDNEGWTPLHAAASCDAFNLVKLLVENGANVCAVNHDGELPVDIVFNESTEMIEYLTGVCEEQGKSIEVEKAAEESLMREDSLRWLKGHDRLAVNSHHPQSGATPLHIAASKGFIDIAKNLLEAGADVNAVDNDLWTPLHAAAHWSLPDSARLLAEYSADFSARNKSGHTPKDLAENDMLRVIVDYERRQQELVEARKKNQSEINTSYKPQFNIARRRSSVSRSSATDKDSLIKKQDVEYERRAIAKRQAATVPDTIPGTPSDTKPLVGTVSPPPPATSTSTTSTHGAVVPQPTRASKVDSDDDSSTVSSVTSNEVPSSHNRLPSTKDTKPTPLKAESAAKVSPANVKPPDSSGDALSELMKELETKEEAKVQVKPRAPKMADSMNSVELKSASVRFQMPFQRAFESNEPLPLPKPRVTESRKMPQPAPKSPSPVILAPTVADLDMKATDVAPEVVEPDPKLRETDFKAKNGPVRLVPEKTQEPVIMPAESGSAEGGEEGGGLKRTASWRVKKTMEAEGEKLAEEKGTSSKLPEPGSSTVSSALQPEKDAPTPNTADESAILIPNKSEEKEISRKQRARFERQTRRSTQGISAADLEMALASPHHHPIREDMKHERERIESKFVASPSLSGKSEDQQQQEGSGPGRQPHEVGYSRSSRYLRMTSRDVDDALHRSRQSDKTTTSNLVTVPALIVPHVSAGDSAYKHMDDYTDSRYKLSGVNNPTPSVVANPSNRMTNMQISTTAKTFARSYDNPVTTSAKPLVTHTPQFTDTSLDKSRMYPTHDYKVSSDYKHFDTNKHAPHDITTTTGANRTFITPTYSTKETAPTHEYASTFYKDPAGYMKTVLPNKTQQTTTRDTYRPDASKRADYVSVSIPFSTSRDMSKLTGDAVYSGNVYGSYPLTSAKPYDRSPDYKPPKPVQHAEYFVPKPTNATIDPSKIYDVYSVKSVDPMETSALKSLETSRAARSKLATGSTALPHLDFTSQRRELPTSRSGGYSRYTPLDKPYTDPYVKSYSDRSLDAYFKEGLLKPSPYAESTSKFGSPSSSFISTPNAYYNAIPTSGLASGRSYPDPGRVNSGLRSPPTDATNPLIRTSSLKDRSARNPRSTYKY